jgi:SAM-dependent methyltransferase
VEADGLKMREYVSSLLDWRQTEAVLDVGCGDGGDLRRMEALAPENARLRLVGLDSSAESIEAARAATTGNPRFSWHQADVSSGLPFADGEFDALCSLNLLECLTDKQAFLSEMHRVLRPGGLVICAHWDHDTHTLDGVDKALVRRIVQAFSDWKQAWMVDADGWMGRRLWPAFQRSGLFAGRIEAYTLTNTVFAPRWYGYEQVQAFGALARRALIAPDDYARLCDDLAAQAARGEYFYSVTLYTYVGRKL